MQKAITLLLTIALTHLSLQSNITHQGYPIPEKTKRLLFYIQRNHNSNTVVYDANFDESGLLVEDDPVHVYWIRYEEQSQTKELKQIEKTFAYGVSSTKTGKNTYNIKLVAKDDKEFILVQNRPFEARIFTYIDGKLSILNSMYIQADNSSFWSDVQYIELFGTDNKTDESTYEKLIF